METQSATGLLQFLQWIPDPRGREGQRHSHVAMLAAMVCATLCNFPGYSGVAQWIRLQPIEFWHALGGKRKPPCENAFRYLLLKLDPAVLEDALMKWVTKGVGLTIDDEQPSQNAGRNLRMQISMVWPSIDRSCYLLLTPSLKLHQPP